MEEPKALDSLFKEKIFRIPDFQRGYAWQVRDNLKDFWEDLINLPDGRSHYTGVLTLKEVPSLEIKRSDKEYWLVEDHSYKMYHIVDGQQRLATFIIFLQAFIEFIRQQPEYRDKTDENIYISESLNISEIINKYLFKVKPTGEEFRTYKFGYSVDNPSYKYLRYRIFSEPGSGSIEETFYTLNLKNAKHYFREQIDALYGETGLDGLHDVYKKLTKRFLFNEYIIKDEFDVFVAFETMNNRGKNLSNLELLKNRLIYLTTLYTDAELDTSDRQGLREDVNDAWKEVYYQLGRNEKRPLNDDDFLRAHWIMYYKYSRKTGSDYIKFLLGEQFAPKKVHKKIERTVEMELPEEQRTDFAFEEAEGENGESVTEVTTVSAVLKPTDIRDYVHSLKESSVHWFNSYFPFMASGLSDEERQSLDRLNLIGMGYFRPLVMAILKNETEEARRIDIFNKIERYIFLVFRLSATRSNYGSSDFYIAARQIEKREIDLPDIEESLNWRSSFLFNSDGSLRVNEFFDLLFRKFENGNGYYDWSGLRYFLYEYELNLLSRSRQKKVDWEDLLKSPDDKISIEHIYPQTQTKHWSQKFESVRKKYRKNYQDSLGNLLLLSMSINSALQNDSFEEKKQPKTNASGQRIRNGYADGSHSEIEVSKLSSWGPEQVKERGIKLLTFMAQRWGFVFKNDAEKEKLLFLH